MKNIAQFSNSRLEEAKPFNPYSPLGEKLDSITLYVKSSKCKEAVTLINKVASKVVANQAKLQRGEEVKIDRSRDIKDDIELATIVLDRVEGLEVEDGTEIGSNKDLIRVLVTEHDWLRDQVLLKANEDSFFYKSEQKS